MKTAIFGCIQITANLQTLGTAVIWIHSLCDSGELDQSEDILPFFCPHHLPSATPTPPRIVYALIWVQATNLISYLYANAGVHGLKKTSMRQHKKEPAKHDERIFKKPFELCLMQWILLCHGSIASTLANVLYIVFFFTLSRSKKSTPHANDTILQRQTAVRSHFNGKSRQCRSFSFALYTYYTYQKKTRFLCNAFSPQKWMI